MRMRKISEESLHPSDKSFTTSSPLFTFARYSIAHPGHPDRNEDAILTDQLRGLAGVFDGVGGSRDGHLASHTAARVIRNAWKRVFIPLQEQCGRDQSGRHECGPYRSTLKTLVELAHAQIHRKGKNLRRATNGLADQYPGTTFVLAAFCQQDSGQYRMVYASVGDSRIYLLRPSGTLQRLTEDDGYFSLLLRKGEIEKGDILRIDQATHPDQLTETELSYFHKRNGITQSLGTTSTPDIHIDQVDIVPGDRILLCSDGIHDNLLDKEIEDILRYSPRTTVARILVNSALRCSDSKDLRAKADDMSAVVITYRN